MDPTSNTTCLETYVLEIIAWLAERFIAIASIWFSLFNW